MACTWPCSSFFFFCYCCVIVFFLGGDFFVVVIVLLLLLFVCCCCFRQLMVSVVHLTVSSWCWEYTFSFIFFFFFFSTGPMVGWDGGCAGKIFVCCRNYIRIKRKSSIFRPQSSRKHAYIILTPLNPTFI